MKSRDTLQELQALRAQLQGLERDHPGTLDAATESRDLGAVCPSSDALPLAAEELGSWLQELQDADGQELLQRIRDEAGDWLDGLDSDLHDMKPSTILALFGLGLLVGRLTK